MSKPLKDILIKFGIDPSEAEEIAIKYEDPRSFENNNKKEKIKEEKKLKN